MDRARFSFIAHATHEHCNPVSPAKLDRALGALDLPHGCEALDIGAGRCDMLCDIAERTRGSGVGVEPARPFAEEARRRIAARSLASRVVVIEQTAAEALASPALAQRRFDLFLCVGALHALEGLDPALKTAAAFLRPGGAILLGLGYWKKPPDPAYLAALGAGEDECLSHAGNVEAIERAGFIPLAACVASDDDWDDYEWRYTANVERFARDNPADPDAPAMLARARSWRTTVLKWGRDTLGFALYAARLDSSALPLKERRP